MKSKSVSYDDVVSMYKVASSGVVKKAASISPDAAAALVGALGGAGVGLVSHLVTPKDKDEDQRQRLLSHVLSGLALGGLGGYGLSRMKTRIADATYSDPPGWYQRNMPELSYSRAATIGGLGAGGYAGFKTLDWLKGKYGLERLAQLDPDAAFAVRSRLSLGPKDLVSADPSKVPVEFIKAIDRANGHANKHWGDILLQKLQNPLPFGNEYLANKTRLGRWLANDSRLGKAISKASRRQQRRDLILLSRLRELGAYVPGSGASPARIPAVPSDAVAKGLSKSRFVNPRKVLGAARRGAGSKKLLAAALAASLLTAGAALGGKE